MRAGGFRYATRKPGPEGGGCMGPKGWVMHGREGGHRLRGGGCMGPKGGACMGPKGGWGAWALRVGDAWAWGAVG